jgi:2,4-diaminopentanoate dehydrogenase
MVGWRVHDGAPVRVALLGVGRMGSAIGRLVTTKPSLTLVGAVDPRVEVCGRDLGEVIGLDQRLGTPVVGGLDQLFSSAHPDVVVQAACSTMRDAAHDLLACVRQGADVVSIAEELSWPWAQSPAMATHLDEVARRHGVTVLGTGVNPGFVLDLLVVALTGVCQRVDAISATRVNDLSPYGPTVLRTQGVGLTPEAFAAGLADGSVVGHVGFPESIAMVAAALGWVVERVDQVREPIVASVARETAFVRVEPGMVAGCNHTAVGWVGGVPRLRLVHPQQVCPEAEGIATGDTIEIRGVPDLRLSGSPEIPGGVATTALAVNMIPHVRGAAPGLVSMLDLPVPAALAGDVLRTARA